MEVKIEYKAKDGTVFTDPYLCESYEKSLEKQLGTLGGFLNFLKDYKETDYFSGIIFYIENEKINTLCALTVDFSDLFEGEFVTQAMKEAQRRVTATVGNIIEFFKDKDLTIPCSGSFFISSDKSMSNNTYAHFSNNELYNKKYSK